MPLKVRGSYQGPVQVGQPVLAGGEFAPEFMQFLPVHFVHIDLVFRSSFSHFWSRGINATFTGGLCYVWLDFLAENSFCRSADQQAIRRSGFDGFAVYGAGFVKSHGEVIHLRLLM